jgi:hypothetical protein
MSSAIVAALSVRSEFVQRNQLEDFYVLFQNLAGQCMEKSTERNDEFRPFEFLGLRYRASVGIDSTREGSPVTDFFSVDSGTVARACVQALMMYMFITKSLVMTPS